MTDVGVIACPHADRCGGCALIDRDAEGQGTWKQERVEHALGPYATLAAITRAPLRPAPQRTHYRTRTKLMVDPRGAIGLYAKGSHDVVDIPHCQVMSALCSATIERLRPMLKGSGVEAVDIREARDADKAQLLVTLVAGAHVIERARSLAAQVASLPHVVGVAVSARDRNAVQLLGRDLMVVSGPSFVIDRVDRDAPFVHASHGSFVQAHRTQANALQQHVIDALGRHLGGFTRKRIVELHCGEGALGLRLSQQGAQVLLVDNFEPAIQRVREAATDQDLTIEAWASDATDALVRLVETQQSIDAVVLDPPRRGVPPLLRRALSALKPKAIAYVSCGPETFARDLDHLRWLGYAPDTITPFDLIPLTEEVECVALLSPAAPPALTVLYEDAQVAIVDKPAHLPTTPQTEHLTSLLQIARAQLKAPDMAAVHRLDATTSGVCILAKHKEHVHAWAQALAAGDKRYTALARGITRDKGSIKRALREGPRLLDARTRFKRDEVIGGHSLITAMPDEGRTHQIRKHLASLGHPLLGDARHGDPKSNRYLEHKHNLDRPFLHCARITLIAPTTGNELTLDAPLAADLEAVLASMRG